MDLNMLSRLVDRDLSSIQILLPIQVLEEESKSMMVNLGEMFAMMHLDKPMLKFSADHLDFLTQMPMNSLSGVSNNQEPIHSLWMMSCATAMKKTFGAVLTILTTTAVQMNKLECIVAARVLMQQPISFTLRMKPGDL